MRSPKEYWLELNQINDDGTSQDWVYESYCDGELNPDAIHVIEHQAYQDLRKVAAEMALSLDRLVHEAKIVNWRVDRAEKALESWQRWRGE